MGIRGKKKDEFRPSVTFRCPMSLLEYLDRESSERRIDRTDAIIDALELDRDVNSGLEAETDRLKAFAESQGLSLDESFGKVLVALVMRGLPGERGHKR